MYGERVWRGAYSTVVCPPSPVSRPFNPLTPYTIQVASAYFSQNPPRECAEGGAVVVARVVHLRHEQRGVVPDLVAASVRIEREGGGAIKRGVQCGSAGSVRSKYGCGICLCVWHTLYWQGRMQERDARPSSYPTGCNHSYPAEDGRPPPLSRPHTLHTRY